MKWGKTMKKVFAKLLVALIIGLYTVNVAAPIIAPAYAAEQNQDQQNPQAPQGDDKKKDGGHSGHHG
jgi:hypothetical protein